MHGLDLGRTQESDFTEDAHKAIKSLTEAEIFLEKYAETAEAKADGSLELISNLEDIVGDCLARINIGLKTARMGAVEDMDRFKSGEKRKMPARSDKTGRNEPCPCGSGKKYKKCCGLLH